MIQLRIIAKIDSYFLEDRLLWQNNLQQFILMEKGFTQNYSKGLFTFYREQTENSKPVKSTHKSIAQEQEPEKPSKRHYVSLSEYDAKKKPRNLCTSSQLQHRASTHTKRQLNAEEKKLKKHLSIKHVFEPQFLMHSPRKNGLGPHLFGGKNRVYRPQTEIYLKKHVRLKTETRHIIGSVCELPANQPKQLFLPKKEHYAKGHLLKKSLLKLSAISARSIQNSTQEAQKHQVIQQIEENGRQFHMALAQSKNHKKISHFSSSIFKNALEMRKHKFENGTFWEEVRLKRQIPSINKMLTSWIHLQQNQSSTTQKNHAKSTKDQQQSND